MKYHRSRLANQSAKRFFKLSTLVAAWQICLWAPLQVFAQQDEQAQAPTVTRAKMTEHERWKLKLPLSTLAVTLVGAEWFCARRSRKHARSSAAERQRFVVAVLHRSTPRRGRSPLNQDCIGWGTDA
ncbi:MAG: hypothetical protein INR62_01245 [Rhodospirillales bacterium]|nr:hypothetical protein [Acetobacter sp.]